MPRLLQSLLHAVLPAYFTAPADDTDPIIRDAAANETCLRRYRPA